MYDLNQMSTANTGHLDSGIVVETVAAFVRICPGAVEADYEFLHYCLSCLHLPNSEALPYEYSMLSNTQVLETDMEEVL